MLCKRIAATLLALAVLGISSQSLAQKTPSDSDHDILVRVETIIKTLERRIDDVATGTRRDADKAAENTSARLELIGKRIDYVATLQAGTFGVMLAVLGGALLIWRKLTEVEIRLNTLIESLGGFGKATPTRGQTSNT